ncbi:MAG: hypothetical protein WCI49_07485 [Ferruginibacter sp.]
MYINIKADTRISDIKKQFSDVYPFLKIEFFKRPHPKHKLSAEMDRIIADRQISTLTKKITDAQIDIDGKRTVLMVEQDFWELFGLSVQVFRKAMNMWIETSFTDSWTLESQNSEGEIFSSKEFRKSMDEDTET